MLKDLIMLRNIHGFSQEEIAEKIGISRQAYAKWESGATVPDIEKCKCLADIYGVTIDSLIKTETIDGKKIILPAPKGKIIQRCSHGHRFYVCKEHMRTTRDSQKGSRQTARCDRLCCATI